MNKKIKLCFLRRGRNVNSRTVRYAINRLKEEEILMERFYFIDSRQSLYEIKRPENMVLAV